MKDKSILVAGASGGIGAAVAKVFSAQGARLALSYSTKKDSVEALKKELGSSVELVSFDISDGAAVSQAVDSMAGKFGKLDGLVNCTGIHESGPLIGMKQDEIDRQIAVNLTGAIYLTQAAVIPMIRQRSGSIVNLGSVSAHRMIRGHSVYSATKAGLEGFTKALAAEVAKRGVRVNCVVPGPVLTPMLEKSIADTGDNPTARIPTGKLVKPEEIAEMCAFLVSDRAPSITGTVMFVDGGYQLW